MFKETKELQTTPKQLKFSCWSALSTINTTSIFLPRIFSAFLWSESDFENTMSTAALENTKPWFFDFFCRTHRAKNLCAKRICLKFAPEILTSFRKKCCLILLLNFRIGKKLDVYIESEITILNPTEQWLNMTTKIMKNKQKISISTNNKTKSKWWFVDIQDRSLFPLVSIVSN